MNEDEYYKIQRLWDLFRYDGGHRTYYIRPDRSRVQVSGGLRWRSWEKEINQRWAVVRGHWNWFRIPTAADMERLHGAGK